MRRITKIDKDTQVSEELVVKRWVDSCLLIVFASNITCK